MTRLFRSTAAFITLLAVVAGSAFAQSGKSKKTVTTGLWGGPHLRMEVTTSGAELEFDCGEATISEPITLDANNTFHVSGSFKVGDFGPTRDEAKPEANAVFTGSVEGDSLKIEMAVAGQDQSRKFNLTHGREARLFKCK